MTRKESYNNLIDVCIAFYENPELVGNTSEMFRKLLTEYFFKAEVQLSKGMEGFFKNFSIPVFIKSASALIDLPLEELEVYVSGSTINDSLAGSIYLSPEYLKATHPHHVPSFNKLPSDVQVEIINAIKEKNQAILESFQKMKRDREADKGRKIITLIALILKNIHVRTGVPFNRMDKSSEEIIRSTFENSDEVFKSSQRQYARLSDESSIKRLIKTFFVVKKFQDITEITEMFKTELNRYRKRAIKG